MASAKSSKKASRLSAAAGQAAPVLTRVELVLRVLAALALGVAGIFVLIVRSDGITFFAAAVC